MKESFWAYLFIILGLFTIVIMMIIQDVTSTDEEDYYLTKEVMEAAMIDSIDYGVYMDTGDIRIIESKFVENFTRRFAESVKDSKTYTLEFYEIYEDPPKATVKVSTSTKEYSVTSDSSSNFDIVNILSGILETKYNKGDKAVSVTMSVTNGKVGSRLKYTSSGGAVTFDVIPNFPYIIRKDNVSCKGINSSDISVGNNTITISNVNSSTSCTADLVKAPYQTTLVVNNGAVASSKKVVATDKNGEASYEVTAFDGYTLDNPIMSCTGGASITRNSNIFSVTGINATQTCNVTLRKAPYKVTFNIPNGGTTVGNPVSIHQGETEIVPIYANVGYTTEGMSVSCDGGATANITNDTIINVSNVNKSQVCSVNIKKITGSYLSYKSNGSGKYDVTIANADGKTGDMKTTYNWGGYTTLIKSGSNQSTFTAEVNGGSQSIDGIVVSISASNVGNALAVTYTIKNTTSNTKSYSVGSHADVYLISNDHVNVIKDSQSKMHTAGVSDNGKTYSVDYIFEPAVTTSWVGFYSNRQSNVWTNSSNGSQTVL